MIFINPGYNREKKLGLFSRYAPISMPIGIGYLASYLIKQNKTVKIIDEAVIQVSDKTLDEYTRGMEQPYIFGLSCLTAGITRGYELAGIIKAKYPDSKVVFGNIHPTVLPSEVLEDRNVDVIVRGEGEEILSLLYERLKNNKSCADIKGISFRNNGRIVHNEAAQLPDLAKIPEFPYYLFEQHSDVYELGSLTSSRGCPYNCIFCSQRSISGTEYRFFPSQLVVQQIEELIFKYKRSYITFWDDSFLSNKKRAMELCEMMARKGFRKKAFFDCQARGDMIDEQVLNYLKAAGFRAIHIGIEAASERLMKLIDKRETLEQIKRGIRLAKKFDFRVSGTFILGFPTETREERKATYRLAKELSLDYVRFNNATPYPGTRLYDMVKGENRFNPGKQWENLNTISTIVESPFKETPLSYVPLTSSEKELRYDILKYNLFYSFRPQGIYKILKERVGPGSWLTLPERWYFKREELVYFLRVGLRILCSFLKIFLYNIRMFFKREG